MVVEFQPTGRIDPMYTLNSEGSFYYAQRIQASRTSITDAFSAIGFWQMGISITLRYYHQSIVYDTSDACLTTNTSYPGMIVSPPG